MWAKALLILFVFSFLFRTDTSFDQDLGRHIKLGEIIWQSKSIPKTNLFSYTNPEFPFINTHWLFGIISYFFNQTVGLQSFLILKVIIFLTSVWLIFKTIPKEKQVLLLPIGFIFLHVLRERLELRPEIFSFLFTAITYFILEGFIKNHPVTSSRAKRGDPSFEIASSLESPLDSLPPRNDGWRLIYLLPFIQLVWINTHIYFFIGLILQAIFLSHLWLNHLRSQSSIGKARTLPIIFILSILISLINPNGLVGFLYPLNVTKNYGYSIVENQTMFLLESINFKNPNFLFVKLSLGLIALSILMAFIKRQFILKNILISILGAALALLNVRSFPYLVFLSLPATVISFSLLKVPKIVANLMLTIFTAMLLLQSFSYLNGEYYKSHDSDFSAGLSLVEKGKEALDFLIKNDLPNPIFNNFDIGSYIIYRGYPKYQVFVDGRPEAFPKEFFASTYIPMQSDYSKFQTEEQKIGFKTVIFSHTDQTPWARNFLQSIVKDEFWKIVYLDDFIIILVKNDVLTEKKLIPISLSSLSPNMYNYNNHVSYLRIGYFLLTTQNIISGKSFLEKTAQIYPNSPTLKVF